MAAAWLAQRDEGLTTEEAAEFSKWRLADARHAAAVQRLEQTWKMLQPLREFRPEARQHPDRDLLAAAQRPASIITFPRLAALAAMAAAVIAMFYLRSGPRAAGPIVNEAVAAMTYATTADGYQRVTLSDGSVLELNANSEARVEMLPAVRHVQLVRGEGHFTVAKNKQRPFIVHANGVDVRAVGTAFNVRLADRGDIEVLVTEGRVHVERQAGAFAQEALPELGVGDRLLVTATPVSGATPRAEKVSAEAMQQTLAWQGPYLRFVEQPLASVVAQFNEHNRVKLELGDATLAAVPIDGRFRPDGVEAFVRLFEADPNSKILVERAGPERIVLRRAP
ncbi:MAG TPA: FecR domain-containing protein [Lacunisphaera sp.]